MKKINSGVIALLLIVTTMTMVWALGNTFRIEPTGVLQEDLVLNLYDNQINDESHTFNSGALATSTAKVNIASAINYTKNGVFGQIASELIGLSGDTQAVSTTKLYCFSYNTTTSTTEVTVGPAGETDIQDISLPAGNILFGYLKIVTPGTHQFVPGTTTIGSNNTATYYNMSFQPSKCRVSNVSR